MVPALAADERASRGESGGEWVPSLPLAPPQVVRNFLGQEEMVRVGGGLNQPERVPQQKTSIGQALSWETPKHQTSRKEEREVENQRACGGLRNPWTAAD